MPKTLDFTGFLGINSLVNMLFTDRQNPILKTFQKIYKKVLTNKQGCGNIYSQGETPYRDGKRDLAEIRGLVEQNYRCRRTPKGVADKRGRLAHKSIQAHSVKSM